MEKKLILLLGITLGLANAAQAMDYDEQLQRAIQESLQGAPAPTMPAPTMDDDLQRAILASLLDDQLDKAVEGVGVAQEHLSRQELRGVQAALMAEVDEEKKALEEALRQVAEFEQQEQEQGAREGMMEHVEDVSSDEEDGEFEDIIVEDEPTEEAVDMPVEDSEAWVAELYQKNSENPDAEKFNQEILAYVEQVGGNAELHIVMLKQLTAQVLGHMERLKGQDAPEVRRQLRLIAIVAGELRKIIHNLETGA